MSRGGLPSFSSITMIEERVIWLAKHGAMGAEQPLVPQAQDFSCLGK
jgi:hypothetical protein